jgi:ankyrin repeat protein
MEDLTRKLDGLMRSEDQTDLHVAIFHRMPSDDIARLIESMNPSQLNQVDSKNRRAIDYLLDWEVVPHDILRKLLQKSANVSEGASQCSRPLIRLCRRAEDDWQLLKLVEDYIPQDLKNKMLEEAVKRGSNKAVMYLLDTGGNAKDTSIKYLLHTAAKSNHESLDKVRRLTSAGLDVSQTNAEGMTLLHVAADGKPPNIEMLLFTLNKGVDPNKQDAKRDTALHKVTKNYSERKITWTKSTQAMIHLLQHPNVDMNIKNAQGLTPLRILMSAKSRLPDSLLSMWLEKGAKIFTDATGGSHESRVKKSGLKTSLVDWSRRPDYSSLIKILIPHLESYESVLKGYLNDMLEAAVADGSADIVGVSLTVYEAHFCFVRSS